MHLLDLIFPVRCLNCQSVIGKSTPLCDECFKKIPRNQTLFCGTCRARLAENKKVCHQGTQFIVGSATDYDCDAVKNLIHGLKFQYLKSAAEPLGELLTEYVKNLNLSLTNCVIVPIPLSKERLRKRGYNQAELIARHFAEKSALPLIKDVLVRIKNTKPQSETKSASDRRENVRGCFAAQMPDAVQGKNILLIDDVITSGATIAEAAAALKPAGAKRIIALTAAKA